MPAILFQLIIREGAWGMHSLCTLQYILICFFDQKGKTLISMSGNMYPFKNAENNLSLSREFVESFWALGHYDQSLCCPEINAFAVLNLKSACISVDPFPPPVCSLCHQTRKTEGKSPKVRWLLRSLSLLQDMSAFILNSCPFWLFYFLR